MVNLGELSKKEVSKPVTDFMSLYGGSHVALATGLRANPDKANDMDFILQCLTVVLSTNKGLTASRLLGRYRRLRVQQEDRMLATWFDDTPDCLL